MDILLEGSKAAGDTKRIEEQLEAEGKGIGKAVRRICKRGDYSVRIAAKKVPVTVHSVASNTVTGVLVEASF